MRILGIPGTFAPTGTAEFLLDHFGLHPQGIFDAALALLEPAGRPETRVRR
jgi:transketolase